MSTTSTNLGLTLWGSPSDTFSYTELYNNWLLIDAMFAPVPPNPVTANYIQKVAAVPAPSSQGKLIYLTAADSGFAANTILRDSGTAWATVGPLEIQSSLPTLSNYQGRLIILSASVSGFNQWDVVINTDGANTWKRVGGVPTGVTVAALTTGASAGSLGVLTAADSGFEAYSLLLYNGSAWSRVDKRGIETGTTLPTPSYVGQCFCLTSAYSVYSSYEVLRWNGTYWQQMTTPPSLNNTQMNALITANLPDGYEIYYQAATGILWRLRWSVADQVWYFLGGPPIYAEVTSQNNNSVANTYQDLSASGPSITLNRAGNYHIEIGAKCKSSLAANITAYMSYTIAGAAAQDADGGRVTHAGGGGSDEIYKRKYKSGIAASSVILAAYKSEANNEQWIDRYMVITPVSVT